MKSSVWRRYMHVRDVFRYLLQSCITFVVSVGREALLT